MYAKKYVRDIDTAQDITQEVFVHLYENRATIDIHTSLKSYLYTIIKNRSLDRLRTEKIHKLHHEKIKNISSTISEAEDKEILYIEKQAKLYNAIQSLPEQNQLIFKLGRFEGKTNQEIADQLQLSKRTVETHISNALKKIKSIVLIAFIFFIYSSL